MAQRTERTVLNHLIETCRDAERGFSAAAAHVESSRLKDLFERMATQRARIADVLAPHAQRLGGDSAAEDDQAVTGVVRRHRDGDAVARNHADVVAAHAAADLCEEFHAIVALDPVVSTGERLHNDALDLNEIVACQGDGH